MTNHRLSTCITAIFTIFLLGAVVRTSFVYAETTDVYEISDASPNSWSRTIPYKIENLLPDIPQNISFTVKNVGSTAANFYLMFDNYSFEDPASTVTEPECDAENGGWVNPTGPCNSRTAINDLDNKIIYTLTIDLYDDSGDLSATIYKYTKSDTVTFDSLEGNGFQAINIPAGWSAELTHGFDLMGMAGNAYQSDAVFFDMTFYAQPSVYGAEDKGTSGPEGSSPTGKVLGASTEAGTGNDLGTPARIVIFVMGGYAFIQMVRLLVSRHKDKKLLFR